MSCSLFCSSILYCLLNVVFPSHLEGKCRFSNVPASSNMCTYAHSQEELDEWIERYRWRAMKRKLAADENLFSYMDRLIEEFNESSDSVVIYTASIISCLLYFSVCTFTFLFRHFMRFSKHLILFTIMLIFVLGFS